MINATNITDEQITAENITDEQIQRELWEPALMNQNSTHHGIRRDARMVIRECEYAIHGDTETARRYARARCAEILNTRAASVKVGTDLLAKRCPPGMFCVHEPRCPGAANKETK